MTTLLHHLRHAMTSPVNLLAGASAVMASAILWNPLPLILYGLGEPLWLARTSASPRLVRELLADHERQLAYLVEATPAGAWMRRGSLPDYATTYARLVEVRAQTAHVVATHRGDAVVLAEDILARMDDMLRAYLAMARERLVFHCTLARVYPHLPEALPELSRTERLLRWFVVTPPREAEPVVPWREHTSFVSVEAAIEEVRAKIAGFERELATSPTHGDVYRPMFEVLARRLTELDERGQNDRVIAAQLRVFPDQFDLILNKLATSHADVGAVIDEMSQLLEQTDETVSFFDDAREGG